MSRPTSISKTQILEAARALFMERGISVSTAAIAKRAGVSEGSIFKRFPTKDQLFEEALGISDLTAKIDLADKAGKGEIEDQLFEISMQFVGFYRQLIPRVMMKWAHNCKTPKGLFEGLSQPPPLRSLRSLTDYLDEEIRLGRLVNIDPEIMARTMLGGLHQFVFFEVAGLNKKMPIAAQTYVRGMIALLLGGAARGEGF